MSTQVRITIEGCKTVVSGIGDGTGGLHVEGPLSSTPESVKDAGGTSSGLSLTAAPHAVHVTTDLKVEGASTLSGGATVTGALTVDTIKPTADRVAVTGELTVSTTGGALKVGTNLEGRNNALTVAGGASVTGGLAVDALKVTKRLIADSATINDELTVGSASLPAGSNVLTVTGGATVSGALTLSGTNLPAGTTVGLAVTAGATVSGALTVGTNLPAGTTVGLAVTGGATISGALTVGTSTQAGTNALTVAGGASVTGGLDADSATVSGALTLSGTNLPTGTTVGLAVTAGATVSGALTVGTNLPAGTTVGLTVTGGATVSGALTVGTSLPSSGIPVGLPGAATAALTVAGGASVTGGLAADVVNISGWLTANTPDTVVQMFTSSPLVTPADEPRVGYNILTWLANTDGFVIAVVGPKDTISVTAGPPVLGTTTFDGTTFQASDGGTLLVPVACNQYFQVITEVGNTSFSFLGMGSSAPTPSKYEPAANE